MAAVAATSSSSSSCFSSSWTLFFLVLVELASCMSSGISLGSRLLANENQTWVSDNGTFAFGFTPTDSPDRLQLAIWFAELPGDRTLVWSANIEALGRLTVFDIEERTNLHYSISTKAFAGVYNIWPTNLFSLDHLNRKSPVSKDAILEFDTTGNLVLVDRDTTVWTSNTSGVGIETAVMADNGNFILYNTDLNIAWQSFSHPSDTLLPGQPLTVSQELTSSRSPSHGGYYTLEMLQQPTSLSLALTYNFPESYDTSPDSYTNYSYWSGPDISNVTGDVVAVMDEAGSFGIVYGSSSDGAVYVYKNDGDNGGLSSTQQIGYQSHLHSNGSLPKPFIFSPLKCLVPPLIIENTPEMNHPKRKQEIWVT